ncbi:hypothetical protein L195_g036053 [Trifolium pratense]|uniref:Pentatricopeptide repeat-containing protein n=1 Tax=Trifolium pratense TaxID=57577 RepID=A0A2K3LNE5_TRIPR|nr:hypothetical protein L195_g036053 [Trifolium pratense]
MERWGVTPNLHCYNIMIDGLCKKKMVDDEAVNHFTEMYSRNMIPNKVTYNSLIYGFCKSGRISYVLDLIDDMRDRGQPANVITYTSLIDALCKSHNLDMAIALFMKIKDREGLFDEVFTLLSKMEDNGCIPNEIVICALFEKGKIDMVEKLLCEMIARELKSSRTLMQILEMTGRQFRLILQMRLPPLRVGSLKEDHEDSAADVGFQASSSPLRVFGWRNVLR